MGDVLKEGEELETKVYANLGYSDDQRSCLI